jgi:hypothetical protein
VKHILEREDDDSKVPLSGPLRRIYNACLDVDEINARGAVPAQEFIQKHYGGWAWQIEKPMKFQVIIFSILLILTEYRKTLIFSIHP